MEFPQGCTSDEDRLEYALEVVAVLEEERAQTAEAIKLGPISVEDYKKYEKEEWLPSGIYWLKKGWL